MIEGTIVMIFTLLLLVWILGIGFLYYQKYVVTTVTNDATKKVAETYFNPSSDLMMGYLATDKLVNRDLYRWNQLNDDLKKVNEEKAEEYIEYKLNKTNFAGTVKNVDAKLKWVSDSPVRKHIEITTTCDFKTPFGIGLSFFGMRDQHKYRYTSRAECTDIIDYLNTIDFIEYQTSLKGVGGEKFSNLINKFITIYNHKYN